MMQFNFRGISWDLSHSPKLMAILNITPDSFSDGGDFFKPEDALKRALLFAEEGADILDVGAESTRPGAKPLTLDEEWSRLEPVLKLIKKEVQIPVSVDTTKAEIAARSLELGAEIINDISGLRHDETLAAVVARYEAGLILMHSRGNSLNMQQLNHYDNLIDDMRQELGESIDRAIGAGISYEQIVVDPGIGFAKDYEQNLSILRSLDQFKSLGRPLLIGPSRKSFIGHILNKEPKDRVWGTAAAVSVALMQGASIFRVHDVYQMKDVIQVTQAIIKQ